jgi:hypothetical protein
MKSIGDTPKNTEYLIIDAPGALSSVNMRNSWSVKRMPLLPRLLF